MLILGSPTNQWQTEISREELRYFSVCGEMWRKNLLGYWKRTMQVWHYNVVILDEYKQQYCVLRLSQSQITYIERVKLKNIFSILEIFMEWNENGVYDFHMLPYGVKRPITEEEEEKILSIKTQYGGKWCHLNYFRDNLLCMNYRKYNRIIRTPPKLGELPGWCANSSSQSIW